MRIYSDGEKGTRKRRFLSVQGDSSSAKFLAVKTADSGEGLVNGVFDGTWVYLTKKDAIRLAGEVLIIASKMED